MDTKREDENGADFVDQVEERYRVLSAEADAALDRLGDLRQASGARLANEVDHVEAARELMSSQVVALRRASDDQFQILRHDIERVSGEFEEAVRNLRRLAERSEPSDQAHAEPGDVAP